MIGASEFSLFEMSSAFCRSTLFWEANLDFLGTGRFTIAAEKIERDSDDEDSDNSKGNYKISSTQKYFPQHNHAPIQGSPTSALPSFELSIPSPSNKRPRSNSNSRLEDGRYCSPLLIPSNHGRRRSLSASTSSSISNPLTPSPTSTIFSHPFHQSNAYEIPIPLLHNFKKPKRRPSIDLSTSEEYLVWRDVLGLNEGEEMNCWKGNTGLSYRTPVLSTPKELLKPELEFDEDVVAVEEEKEIIELLPPPAPLPPTLPSSISTTTTIRQRKKSIPSRSRNTPSGPIRSTTRNTAKIASAIGYAVPFYLLDRENVAREEQELAKLEKEGGNTGRGRRRSNSSSENYGTGTNASSSRWEENLEFEGEEQTERDRENVTPDTSFEEERDRSAPAVGLGLTFEEEEEELLQLLMKEDSYQKTEEGRSKVDISDKIAAGSLGHSISMVRRNNDQEVSSIIKLTPLLAPSTIA